MLRGQEKIYFFLLLKLHFWPFFFLSTPWLKAIQFQNRHQILTSMYFPPKFEIFKFFFLMVFAIKMLLDNTYGLPNFFEFKSNHFKSLFQAEYEFENSNFGGKYIDVKISCRFWNWIAFSGEIHKTFRHQIFYDKSWKSPF